MRGAALKAGKLDHRPHLTTSILTRSNPRCPIAAATARSGRVPPGVIYDAPLLFEAGLDKECDAVVFRPDIILHEVKPVTKGRRLLWTVGVLK